MSQNMQFVMRLIHMVTGGEMLQSVGKSLTSETAGPSRSGRCVVWPLQMIRSVCDLSESKWLEVANQCA